MKNKTYRWVLGLFLSFFFGVIAIFCILSFKDNILGIKQSYLREYNFLVNSITKDFIALEGRKSDIHEAADACYRDYGMRYMRQNIHLQGYYKEECMYTSFKEQQTLELNQIVKDKNNIVIQVVTIEGQKYIRICGYLPDKYNEYGLVYYADITSNIDSWVYKIIYLLIGATLFSGILSICLLILIEHLFRPLEQISMISKEIASGNYDEKLDIKGEGEIGEVVSSFNTMSDTIKAQIKKLEDNATEKQMLIDNLAHELKTPLTAVYGYAEYIQKTKLNDQDKYECTGFILHESSRLKTISEMLLNLAVLREETELEKKQIKVDELLKRLHQLENVKLREKGIQLKLSNEIDELYGNEELIESMLINLIDNAIKACDKPKSKIEIRGYEKQGHQIIEVQDNGKGMTKEQVSHVTEAFYRVDKSRSRKEGGNGLGLTLCQVIANKHDAKLNIESELNQGTKVSIVF